MGACVRYQRLSLFNKSEKIENINVGNRNSEENEKSEEVPKANVTTFSNDNDDTSINSDLLVKKKKTIYQSGETKNYSKIKNFNNPSSSNTPFSLKKKRHKQNSLHENKQKLLAGSSNLQFNVNKKKRKLDSSISFGKKKKKIKLSSIFEPEKKNVKKEGPLLKSKYHGVFWNRTSKTWMGKYSYGGKTYHVTSGKSEKKIAKAVRKAVRVAKKLGMKPKKPYGKLKEPNPPKLNTNSVKLTSDDIVVIPTNITSESIPELPTITKIRSSLLASAEGSMIDNAKHSTNISNKKHFPITSNM